MSFFNTNEDIHLVAYTVWWKTKPNRTVGSYLPWCWCSLFHWEPAETQIIQLLVWFVSYITTTALRFQHISRTMWPPPPPALTLYVWALRHLCVFCWTPTPDTRAHHHQSSLCCLSRERSIIIIGDCADSTEQNRTCWTVCSDVFCNSVCLENPGWITSSDLPTGSVGLYYAEEKIIQAFTSNQRSLFSDSLSLGGRRAQ